MEAMKFFPIMYHNFPKVATKTSFSSNVYLHFLKSYSIYKKFSRLKCPNTDQKNSVFGHLFVQCLAIFAKEFSVETNITIPLP